MAKKAAARSATRKTGSKSASKRSTTTAGGKRGRTQDRARVAGRQDYEMAYEARKTGTSRGTVKKAATAASASSAR